MVLYPGNLRTPPRPWLLRACTITVPAFLLFLAVAFISAATPSESLQANEVSAFLRFKLFSRTSGTRSWENFRDFCVADGGWLANDISEESGEAIRNAIFPAISGHIILGGTDIAQLRTWRWATGPPSLECGNTGRVFTHVVSGAPECQLDPCFWNGGQPSHDTERYLARSQGDQHRWNDHTAAGTSANHFVCEYATNDAIAEFEFLSTLRFYAHSGGVTWSEARQLCSVYGGWLAVAINNTVAHRLASLVAKLPVNTPAWIGATDFSERGRFRWVTGPFVDDEDCKGRTFLVDSMCLFASPGCTWGAGQPQEHPVASLVALVHSEEGSHVLTTAGREAKLSGFICGFPEVARLGGVSGRFRLYNRSHAISWSAAKDFCIDDGGWLANDVSDETHSVIVELNQAKDQVWLGGSDDSTEGTWRWVTGPFAGQNGGAGLVFHVSGIGATGALCNLQPCFWGTSQPDNAGGGEDWLQMHFFDAGERWNDAPIDSNYRYARQWVCEYNPPIPERPAIEFNSSITYFSRADSGGLSWPEARQLCAVYGGALLDLSRERHLRLLVGPFIDRLPSSERGYLSASDAAFGANDEWHWIVDNNFGPAVTGDECVAAGGWCSWPTIHSPPIPGGRYLAASAEPASQTSFVWSSLAAAENADGFFCVMDEPILANRSGRFALWNRSNPISHSMAKQFCEDNDSWLATAVSNEAMQMLVEMNGDDQWAFLGGESTSATREFRYTAGPLSREDGDRGRLFYVGLSADPNRRCIGQPCPWNPQEPNDYLEWGEFSLQLRGSGLNDAVDYPWLESQITRAWFCENHQRPFGEASRFSTIRVFRANSDDTGGQAGISWYEARHRCIIFNASMVTLHSELAAARLATAMRDLPEGARVWVAGADFEGDGAWRWAAGTWLDPLDSGLGKLFFNDSVCLNSPAACAWEGEAPASAGAASRFLFASLDDDDDSAPRWNSMEVPGKVEYYACVFPTATTTPSTSISPTASDSLPRTPTATASPTGAPTPSATPSSSHSNSGTETSTASFSASPSMSTSASPSASISASTSVRTGSYSRSRSDVTLTRSGATRSVSRSTTASARTATKGSPSSSPTFSAPPTTSFTASESPTRSLSLSLSLSATPSRTSFCDAASGDTSGMQCLRRELCVYNFAAWKCVDDLPTRICRGFSSPATCGAAFGCRWVEDVVQRDSRAGVDAALRAACVPFGCTRHPTAASCGRDARCAWHLTRGVCEWRCEPSLPPMQCAHLSQCFFAWGVSACSPSVCAFLDVSECHVNASGPVREHANGTSIPASAPSPSAPPPARLEAGDRCFLTDATATSLARCASHRCSPHLSRGECEADEGCVFSGFARRCWHPDCAARHGSNTTACNLDPHCFAANSTVSGEGGMLCNNSRCVMEGSEAACARRGGGCVWTAASSCREHCDDIGCFVRFTPRPQTAVEQARDTSTQVAVGTVMATSMVSGGPVSAVAMSKMAALLGISSCDFDHEEPLPALLNPTGFGFGPAHGRFYRGAVVANIGLFGGLVGLTATLVALVALVRRQLALRVRRRREADASTSERERAGEERGALTSDAADAATEPPRVLLLRTATDMHFPSVFLIFLAVGLEGTTAASTACLIHAAQPLDYAIGGVGILLVCCVVAWGFVVSSWVKEHCHIAKRTPASIDPSSSSSPHAPETRSLARRALQYWTISDEYWTFTSPEGRCFKRRWYFFFAEYRSPWFLAYDVFSLLLLGLTDGLRISDPRVCIALVVVSLINSLIMLVLILAFRMTLVRIDTVFLSSVSLGTLAMCCAGFAQLLIDDAPAVERATEYISTGVVGVVLLKSLLDILLIAVLVQDKGKITLQKLFDPDAARSDKRTLRHKQFALAFVEVPLLEVTAADGDGERAEEAGGEQRRTQQLLEELDDILGPSASGGDNNGCDDDAFLDQLLLGGGASLRPSATTAKFGEGGRLYHEVQAGLASELTDGTDDYLSFADASQRF